MARTTRPSIQPDKVIRTALKIIDDVGIDDLLLERLAKELDIRAPSLYYHFRGRAHILSEVARVIIVDVRLPDEPPPHEWQRWFIDVTNRF